LIIMIETFANKINRLLEDEVVDKVEIRRIQPDTYKQITSYIKSIRSEGADRDKNVAAALTWAERKILHDISSRLIELRIAKFTRDPEADTANLTPEERYIIEPLIQSNKRLDRIEKAIFNGQVSQLEQASNAIKQKFVVARFLQPYTAITGTDLATYGPFEAEDVSILPFENAKQLLKIGIISQHWVESSD
jgi:DNA replication initiation complex subunit (GINS family)